MKDLASQPIELAGDQQRFLQDMADKHGLPDVGKAIRCLVNYARDNPHRQEEIFGEVRCLDC
jgi:hypothetical protein